jgi:hypothetical protein
MEQISACACSQQPVNGCRQRRSHFAAGSGSRPVLAGRNPKTDTVEPADGYPAPLVGSLPTVSVAPSSMWLPLGSSGRAWPTGGVWFPPPVLLRPSPDGATKRIVMDCIRLPVCWVCGGIPHTSTFKTEALPKESEASHER